MKDFLEHFSFTQAAWLWALVPALFLLFLRRQPGSLLSLRFPNISALKALKLSVRERPWHFAFAWLWLAATCSILALARPVWREVTKSSTSSGIDIQVALDLSLSMGINDFREGGKTYRRLDVAKFVLDDFIKNRPNDRIGLLIFSGQPYNVSPITLDHDWLRAKLRDVELNQLDADGTAIGSALSASAGRLQQRDAKSKIIILVTDGANNRGKIAPLDAANLIAKLGIKVYTIAIGSPTGRVNSWINANTQQEFDLPTLKKIASITGGEQYYAQNLASLRNTFQSINHLEKTEAKTLTVVDDTELFPYFLAATLLCALAASLTFVLNPPSQV